MDLLTTTEVAERLRVSVTTVRQWIRDGILPAYDFGRRAGYRVAREDLEAYMASRVKESADADED